MDLSTPSLSPAITQGTYPDALRHVDAIAVELAKTAAARDRAGGHAPEQKALLRAGGLLALPIATQFGGAGASWQQCLNIVQRLARVDSALAHLLAFQYLQLSGVIAYGSDDQQATHLSATAGEQLWWGNAANPADPRLLATADGDGWQLNGTKGFCSGSVGSDRLLITAIEPDSGARLIAVLPTRREGVTLHDDWDPIGQRQTDSVTITFADVRISHEEVLHAPGQGLTPFLSLRGLLAQQILVSLFIGIAEGAIEAGRDYTLNQSRPWHASGVERAADDPYILHRYAELNVAIVAANAVARIAESALDAAWSKRDALDASERGELAVKVAQAKVLAHRAALAAGEGIFDVSGARATRALLGLDRFWRNARTHTLHDPIDYKLRDIGRYALEGRLPEPTLYS